MPTKMVTLQSGAEIKVKPVSARLLEQFDKNHKKLLPIPPMREAQVAGGGTEQVPDYDDPEYQTQLAEYNARSTNDMLNLLVEFGLDVTLPDDDTWLRQLQKVGVTVELADYKSAYVQYILMSDYIEDVKTITREVMVASGVSEEAIKDWAELF